MDNMVTNDSTQKKFSLKTELFEWFEAVVFSLAIVILLFTFVFRIVGVDGSSMFPTLKTNDRVVISHLFYKPQQGDIVVITQPNSLHKPLIKRIIALGGQTVDIDFDKHIVKVDGKELNEFYINEPTARKENVTFPIKVPKGHAFVMGDNRNNSLDSRSTVIGFIDERYIIGKAFYRIFPLQDIKFLS